MLSALSAEHAEFLVVGAYAVAVHGLPRATGDLLERLLAMPYYLSPAWLRIDPTVDPLRKHPRFQRLVEQEPSA